MEDPATDVPITPGSEDGRSEVEESYSSETTTSFNTTASEGESEESTLHLVLTRVCKLTKFPELEEYDFGIVAVRKLIILSNYCKVHDKFPPLDISMN